MRLVLEKRSGQETLVLKHNIARCKVSDSPFARTLTLADVLKDVYAFLNEHPSETVILCMKAENSKDDVAAVQKALYDRSGVRALVSEKRDPDHGCSARQDRARHPL